MACFVDAATSTAADRLAYVHHGRNLAWSFTRCLLRAANARLLGLLSVTGFGYFSGRDIRVEFWPAAEHAGITFVRHDLGRRRARSGRRSACGSKCRDARRSSSTAFGSKWSSTCWPRWPACGIDNCEVWVDAAEMPGCDGSSKAFVEAIDAAGVVEQRSPVPQIVVGQSVRVGDEDSWIEAQPSRSCRALDLLRARLRDRNGHWPAALTLSIYARFVPPRIGSVPHVHSGRSGRRHARRRASASA